MGNVKSIKITRLDSQFEAFGALASFVFFVITHPFTPVSVLTIGLIVGNAYSIQDYFRSEKAQIEEAKPVGSSFSFLPQAIAQDKDGKIMIDGIAWGVNDPDVDVWKLKDLPAVLLHKKSENIKRVITLDALKPERLKK